VTFSRSCEAGGVDWGSGAQQVETQVRRKSINSVIWPQIVLLTIEEARGRIGSNREAKEPRVFAPLTCLFQKAAGSISVPHMYFLSVRSQHSWQEINLRILANSECALYVNCAFAGNSRLIGAWALM